MPKYRTQIRQRTRIGSPTRGISCPKKDNKKTFEIQRKRTIDAVEDEPKSE